MAYQITDVELKKLQDIELEMLLELDRICRKHNILYSLDGGTLLGAVRHHGFIPWDDDADVIFLRKEYERFRTVCETELDTERFFLQDYRSDEYYRWGYAKLRRNHTAFIREGQEHLKLRHSGVFLDIFVADNVPDGYFLRRLHHFGCFFVRKGLYAAVGKKSEKQPALRMIYRMLDLIPRDFYFKLRNALFEPMRDKKTELIAHYTLEYPAHCRYGLPRECFDDMRKAEFEGHLFSVFENADLYLKTYYGDYMILPPKEKRKPHLTLSKLTLCEPELP